MLIVLFSDSQIHASAAYFKRKLLRLLREISLLSYYQRIVYIKYESARIFLLLFKVYVKMVVAAIFVCEEKLRTTHLLNNIMKSCSAAIHYSAEGRFQSSVPSKHLFYYGYMTNQRIACLF